MSLLGDVLGWFSSDLAIDLGTATTLVYVRGRGIMLSEPSVVALEKQSNAVLAVGAEAKRMFGRTPGNIVAIRPIKEGVIADFAMTEQMLHYFITKAHNRRSFVRPRCIIGVPSRITEVEQTGGERICHPGGRSGSVFNRRTCCGCHWSWSTNY